jgi:serine/threonine protein phosphatase PrpC
LIAEANARGGVDNITAVVIRIHSSPAMTTGTYPVTDMEHDERV